MRLRMQSFESIGSRRPTRGAWEGYGVGLVDGEASPRRSVGKGQFYSPHQAHLDMLV